MSSPSEGVSSRSSGTLPARRKTALTRKPASRNGTCSPSFFFSPQREEMWGWARFYRAAGALGSDIGKCGNCDRRIRKREARCTRYLRQVTKMEQCTNRIPQISLDVEAHTTRLLVTSRTKNSLLDKRTRRPLIDSSRRSLKSLKQMLRRQQMRAILAGVVEPVGAWCLRRVPTVQPASPTPEDRWWQHFQ